MQHLIEILLPLSNNSGRRFPQRMFDDVRQKLADRFGGVTAFTRAPAEGVNKEGGRVEQDEIVIFEVMCDELDHDWWRSYRAVLEKDFEQREILIRTHPVTLL